MAKKAAKKTAARKTTRGPTLMQRTRAVAPGQKALYHHVLGAGRSRVKREFFGANERDLNAVVDLFEHRLGQRLSVNTPR